MANDLAGLVERLEAVATKLEGLALSTPAAAHDQADGAHDSAAGNAGFVDAFEELCNTELAVFLKCAAVLGDELAAHADLLKAAFEEEKRLLVIASQKKKPPPEELQAILKPLSEAMSAVGGFRDLKENRRTKFPNHLATVCEGVPALGWVALDAKPVPFVKEMADASEFYNNRVLKDFRDVGATHVDWVRSFKKLLAALQEYVRTWHTTGLAWNPKGGAAATAAPKPTRTPSAGPQGPAPVPPTIPQKPGAMGLFTELSKGTAITAGLKKVDKSQMTHKNPELRASAVVKAHDEVAKPAAAPRAAGKGVTGPPKFELEGKRWAVEHQQNNQDLVIDDPKMSETVYIYKCTKCTVKINKKVNSIVIDGCKKVAVVFDTVVSSFEAVNCQGVQVQVLNTVPTINLDKTDGAQVYLSKESLGVEIFTAKCSELNVVVPGDSPDQDMVEHPLPEQFRTKYNVESKKFITETTESVA